jgi:bifunctional DNase/RNase
MELSRLIINQAADEQIVILKEIDGPRAFSIVIGFNEAAAIHRYVNGEEAPRPLTHDLVRNVIEGMGAKLDRILVNDLRNRTFYARLMLKRNGQEIEIDARPSDAIALAIQAGVPIFVEEAVVEAVGQEPQEPESDEDEGGEII